MPRVGRSFHGSHRALGRLVGLPRGEQRGIEITGHNVDSIERDQATSRTSHAPFALMASIVKINKSSIVGFTKF